MGRGDGEGRYGEEGVRWRWQERKGELRRGEGWRKGRESVLIRHCKPRHAK